MFPKHYFMKYNYILIFCLCLLILNLTNCQEVSLEKTINYLIEAGTVDHEHIGITGHTSETYKHFEKLRALANMDQLIQLTKHENIVIACYAVWALCDRQYAYIEELFEELICDERKFSVASGCLFTPSNLSTQLYLRIKYGEHYALNYPASIFYYHPKHVRLLWQLLFLVVHTIELAPTLYLQPIQQQAF